MHLRLRTYVLAVLLLATPLAANAQGPGGPPSVGVIQVKPEPVTESSEFIGRIQSVGRVSLTARVTAFLEKQLFVDGTEVKKGDLLFQLERGPYEAAVQQQEASVADISARLANANIQLGRTQQLLSTPAGQRSAVDDAVANQRSLAAQLMSAQAQLRQAQINLAYTEIHAPIDGKISRAAITVGNVVGPNSVALATIVSQDPMYVLFPVATRTQAELEKRYADRGGMDGVVVKIQLPDGSMYGAVGKIDYIDPSVTQNTDTIILRASIPNPPTHTPVPEKPVDRPLIDGAFVNVLVQGAKPIMALSIPRSAVLADQQGSYVYVVGEGNKVEQRRIELGQSTQALAVISSGLKEGETVIVDGLQRARPGLVVAPTPFSPPPASPGQSASR